VVSLIIHSAIYLCLCVGRQGCPSAAAASTFLTCSERCVMIFTCVSNNNGEAV